MTHVIAVRVGKNHNLKKSDFFYLNQIFCFFFNIRIIAIFSLYYAQHIAKVAENLSSIVSCTMHIAHN